VRPLIAGWITQPWARECEVFPLAGWSGYNQCGKESRKPQSTHAWLPQSRTMSVDLQGISLAIALVSLIAAVVMYFRSRRTKSPIWAVHTDHVIGLGANALPGILLTFDGRQVTDVYRSVVLFLNRGRQAIRREDLRSGVDFRLSEGFLLRPPATLAHSKSENKFDASLVDPNMKGFTLTFDFLDYRDGVLLELLHTAEGIDCNLTLIESDPLRQMPRVTQSRFVFPDPLRRLERIPFFILSPVFAGLAGILFAANLWDVSPAGLNPSLQADSNILIAAAFAGFMSRGIAFTVSPSRPQYRYRFSNPRWLQDWLDKHNQGRERDPI